MNPQKSASVSVLMVMSALGWVLTCIFGVLVCFLAADARGRDVPWQVLGALVLGPILSSIPIAVLALVAYRAFGDNPAEQSAKSTAAGTASWLGGLAPWRGLILLALVGAELLLFPLTIALAAGDDDTLLLTIPLNVLVVFGILLAACLPYRQRLSIALFCIHLAGIVIAAFCAAIDIESVVVTGLFLLVTGTVLASIGERPHAMRIVFGLSTSAFILAAFIVIAAGNVGQREADAPLFAAIVAYQIIFVPIGLLALRRAWTRTGPATRLQFDLKQLLSLMGAVCLAAAAARVSYMIDDDFQIAFAAGLGMLIISCTAAVFLVGRKVPAGAKSTVLQKPHPA